jgi:fumarate hydratase class II
MMTSTINITQSEILKGIARQVIQNLIDVAVTAPFESSEYNRFKAVAIHNILCSIQMIINAVDSFTANVSKIKWI